ncbi:hypothetical protein, partial [Thiolapillus sp.]|uniref:hypothetical protein n=1 Tax=Thiolapillus sp. TaxID=2017437 RepID=UPI0025F53002
MSMAWNRARLSAAILPEAHRRSNSPFSASNSSRSDCLLQACLRPRDRFWDIPVPKIDSAFDNLLVPQPSWSPSTTQQL